MVYSMIQYTDLTKVFFTFKMSHFHGTLSKAILYMPTRTVWPSLLMYLWPLQMLGSIMCIALILNFTQIMQ